MKIKTSELEGDALDWAVAQCVYENKAILEDGFVYHTSDSGHRYTPSANWNQGGPIIEREGLWVQERYPNVWDAFKKIQWEKRWGGILVLTGPTYLIAAMRCYVASKMGDEIEIPDEVSK